MGNIGTHQWLAALLALPVGLVVALILRYIWAPVSRVLFSPFKRILGPEFDSAQLTPYVIRGGFAGSCIGWIVFSLFFYR